MAIEAPVLLDDRHELSQIDSGVPPLNEWLVRRARANALTGTSRTYVACDGRQVVGYYALASGAVAVGMATGRFKRNMPDPIPVVVLARLAVDRNCQGQGLGRALFRDAAIRVLRAADIVGIRGMVVDAISMEAKAFYQALGMVPSPLEPMLLLVTTADLTAGFQ